MVDITGWSSGNPVADVSADVAVAVEQTKMDLLGRRVLGMIGYADWQRLTLERARERECAGFRVRLEMEWGLLRRR